MAELGIVPLVSFGSCSSCKAKSVEYHTDQPVFSSLKVVGLYMNMINMVRIVLLILLFLAAIAAVFADDFDDYNYKGNIPDYLIIGAGGAGIQTALFLLPWTSSFTILEKSSTVGSFWTR